MLLKINDSKFYLIDGLSKGMHFIDDLLKFSSSKLFLKNLGFFKAKEVFLRRRRLIALELSRRMLH